AGDPLAHIVRVLLAGDLAIADVQFGSHAVKPAQPPRVGDVRPSPDVLAVGNAVEHLVGVEAAADPRIIPTLGKLRQLVLVRIGGCFVGGLPRIIPTLGKLSQPLPRSQDQHQRSHQHIKFRPHGKGSPVSLPMDDITIITPKPGMSHAQFCQTGTACLNSSSSPSSRQPAAWHGWAAPRGFGALAGAVMAAAPPPREVRFGRKPRAETNFWARST